MYFLKWKNYFIQVYKYITEKRENGYFPLIKTKSNKKCLHLFIAIQDRAIHSNTTLEAFMFHQYSSEPN